MVSQPSIAPRDDGPTPENVAESIKASNGTGEEKAVRHGSATLASSKRKVYDNVAQASMETLLINKNSGDASPIAAKQVDIVMYDKGYSRH